MRRKLLLFGGAILAVTLISVAIVLTVDRSPGLQNTVLKIANVTTPPTNTSVANTNTPDTQAARDREAVTYVARNFAEQLGSGSNQNNFAHLEEAKQWGTTAYADALTRSIAQQRAANVTTPYRGTITKALVIKITTISTTAATVTVTTQREETVGTTASTFYQDLTVDLVKVGTDWKISTANWKPV